MAYQVSPGVNVTEVDLSTIVPGVSTSSGAIAGLFRWGPVGERVLIDSETKLVDIFGKPTSHNPETFFTAANFLNYSNSLWVVRAANTTDTTDGALTAFASDGTPNTTIAANVTVKNSTDYDGKTDFHSGVSYIARYPGDLGNTLRISVCDSTDAYSSNVSLITANATANISAANGASFALSVGSNTATITVKHTANGDVANAAVVNFSSYLTVGDKVTVGNSTIGYQYMKVTAIPVVNGSTVNATGNVATITLSFADKYKLAADFTSTANTVQRNWEFFDVVESAPTTSEFVSLYGNTSAVDGIHTIVVDQDGKFSGVSGSILEVFQGLSRATDAKSADGASIYYKNAINQGSRYIWWANDRSGAVSNVALSVTTSTNLKPFTVDFVSGQDGLSEANVTVATLASGYDLFKPIEAVDVSLIMQGKPIGATSNSQLANYLIDNIATLRKDCVVFVSPDDAVVKNNTGNEASALVTWRNNINDSTYAMIDSGYKYMYDRYNDIYRYVPLNGDVAGLTARTEFTNDAWWSPAGFNRGQIKNIVKLRYNPTKADRDLMYKNAVNPVVTFPGQGTVLFGDKTATSKPSAFDRINVRRLFIVLEKAISQSAKYSLFEFNDDFTRSQFVNLVTPYLRDVQARRGITDFLVVCDSTNNTPERVDRNEFWGDIYIKPARSINFIQLNFVAVRTGVDFSTIVGRF